MVWLYFGFAYFVVLLFACCWFGLLVEFDLVGVMMLWAMFWVFIVNSVVIVISFYFVMNVSRRVYFVGDLCLCIGFPCWMFVCGFLYGAYVVLGCCVGMLV